MRGLFNMPMRLTGLLIKPAFQSALRMRGLFNSYYPWQVAHFYSRVSIRLADAWPFQPAERGQAAHPRRVSIRLADAWPFQPGSGPLWSEAITGFNPPCGCVAFSTATVRQPRTRPTLFQSALRMRGLFNR